MKEQMNKANKLVPALSLVLSGLCIMVPTLLGNHTAEPERAPEGMVLITGGSFKMGNSSGHPDEAPLHRVALSPYFIDRTEVTNRQFAAFVAATGHVTQAEKDGFAWAYLEGASDFHAVQGAWWRAPEGPGSGIEDKMDHPVVCVSWEDAAAYAAWAGKRLPTEAEWEYAARSGAGHVTADDGTGRHTHGTHVEHGTGNGTADLSPSGKAHRDGTHPAGPAPEIQMVKANVWQGTWPTTNQQSDGFFYTAPVGSFPANGFGIHDMLGNVWEWTADWYAADYYAHSPALDPRGPNTGQNRVARGGSWFCSPNYCGAYNSHFRGASPPNGSFNNVGFRCAMDAPDSATAQAQ